jgi:predicted TIM-barrel fold metal-dependent hydrolase
MVAALTCQLPEARLRIVDTHLHLIYPQRFRYSWIEGETKLNREWNAGSWWAEAEGLGIEAALHMEVDVDTAEMLDETRFMLGVHKRVIGAIASGRPESPDFAGHLEALAGLGRVKGVRRLLQFQPPELSAGALFRENVRRLPVYGMSFDICVKSHELAVAAPLIDACPDVQFVLDHCGNPKVAEGEWEGWAAHIDAIAARPNVVCKVSGILANVADGWTVAQLRPYVEHVIGRFGWDRVIWGSDHPVVTLFAGLTAWVRATEEIVAGASAAERAKLWHGNAERLWG